ncbi:DUF805 domain-containing protein [Streptomyces synnematoformans]|uniref:DUF805 domain-containing protein n=1 Tax=Streptomyces synnematoformans TaxID=415721 RepID=A0ABP4KP22_9ACTN
MSLCFVPFRRYADFTGRARRREFWSFMLLILVPAASLVVAALLSGSDAVWLAFTSYLLVTFLPALAASVRRLHDAGRSGWWWLLVAFVPFGGIAVLVFLLLDSEARDNDHGPRPKPVPVPAHPASPPPA